MIDRILEFSLRQRVFVLLAAAVLLGVGVYYARELPIDAVPDITSPQVQVNTQVDVLAPEEAENLVTRVIEQELAGLPGVTDLRSLTKYGLSQVTLQFEDGVDVYRCRQLVAERLQNVRQQLPAGAEPRLAPISTGLGEIFYYTLSWQTGATNRPGDESEALMQLYEAQEYIAKPFLRSTPGVAEVNAIGGLIRQYIIEPDPQKLHAANVTFEELAEIISRNTSNGGGGIINQNGRKLIVRSVGKAQTGEELGGLPVKFGAAVTPILVKDLAVIRVGAAPRMGAATANGEESVIGSVMMLAGENSRVVAHRVQQRLQTLMERLPAGITAEVQYDRSELVDRTVETVKKNLFEGAIFVVVVLLLLLGNIRAALIVAAAIPLSFLCAIIGMNSLGISGNLMSLGAVDFGLIIDGAVVIVENIVRQLAHRQQHLGRPLKYEERMHTVLSASKQVASPMFFGVIIITIVYVPILALAGVEGKMFKPMAVTVMLALGGALVLALTLMPALCSFLLGGKISEKENFILRFAKRLYAPALDRVLRWRWPVFGSALALFVGSVLVFNRLGAEFSPKLDEGATTMMLYRPVGQSLEASLAAQKKIDRLIMEKYPEVSRVFSRIGTAEVATDPMAPNEADFYVFYKPRGEWQSRAGRVPTKAELADLIGETIQQGGFECDVMVAQPIEMRFNEMLEGIRADLAVKVFGPDFDVLEKKAAEIKTVLEGLPGAASVEFETEGRPPILTLSVKREELARRGINSDAVNAALATAVAGQPVGTLQRGLRVHEVIVRLPGELRERVDRIKELPVRVGEYGLLKLGDLVHFETIEAVEPIRRDDAKRRAALMVNLRTKDVEGWVRDAQRLVKEKISLPDGYTLEFGGQFQRLEAARARLMIVVPAALALIFVLIFMAFGSLRQAAIVYTGIPLALTGGIFALWLRDMPFSITAAIGFIALSGVAVLNGVVLVSYFNELREQTTDDLRASIIEGSLTRLRPVLMTAMVAALGFFPMAVSTGAGAEVQQPLATVVIGGIISSTFLTLIVLPALYWTIERNNHKPTPETNQPE
jgi:cobalt-zinc-cadmium resistance protein CzcA